MGLLVMILGLVLFLGVHTLTTRRDLRARLIAAWGEGAYKIGYALLALSGLVLMVWGFAIIARPAGSMSGLRRKRSNTSPWR